MDGRNRDCKTSMEQWNVIIDFMEENPSLLKNKFKNFDGDREDGARLWQALTRHLNSMGLGARITEKWQLAIGRWESKTKRKASQLRMERERTGGGPVQAPPLNQGEERLMALLGWKSVTGDKNLELGLPPLMPTNVADRAISSISSKAPVFTTYRAQMPSHSSTAQMPSHSSTAQMPSPPSKTHMPSPPYPPYKAQMSSLPSKTELPVLELVGSLPQLAATKKRKLCDENMPKGQRQVRVTNDKSRKFVTLTKMHSDTMQRLQSIDKNVQIMANALQSISQNFEIFVNNAVE